LFLASLDPPVFEQAAERPVQSAGAEPHSPVAHPLGVLKDGITVPGLFRKTEKDEQDRLTYLHMSSNDMSFDAMFHDS